jgi:hypothetical protein
MSLLATAIEVFPERDYSRNCSSKHHADAPCQVFTAVGCHFSLDFLSEKSLITAIQENE